MNDHGKMKKSSKMKPGTTTGMNSGSMARKNSGRSDTGTSSDIK
jgi:hypothetical protein